tara:strand:- start:327 stop:1550 length:1224 start_codon:yes stop_codon:yes gene_type:complete
MTHKVLDLFSGIGGFSLGLQNTGGFETVAFCEIEPYCHRVLNKHWKDVPIYNDIKELTYDTLQADGIEPDVITGGFPCQDISVAGKQKGIIGERSSLWSEYARLIEDVRPKWAIIENVPTLRSKGLTLVLQNLSEIGYHAEWHCIPCSAIGGLHRRDRIWIIAYPLANSRCTFGQGSIIEGENANEVEEEFTNQYQRSSSTPGNDTGTQGSEEGIVANSNTRHGNNEEEEIRTGREAIDSSGCGERGGGKENEKEAMGNSNNSRSGTPQRRTNGVRKEEDERREGQPQSRSSRSSSTIPNSMCEGLEGSEFSSDNSGQDEQGSKSSHGSASKPSGIRREPELIVSRGQLERYTDYAKTQWAIEPNVGRVAYGIPRRVDRLRGLGNAVLPQIPQFLGECILNFEKENI